MAIPSPQVAATSVSDQRLDIDNTTWQLSTNTDESVILYGITSQAGTAYEIGYLQERPAPLNFDGSNAAPAVSGETAVTTLGAIASTKFYVDYDRAFILFPDGHSTPVNVTYKGMGSIQKAKDINEALLGNEWAKKTDAVVTGTSEYSAKEYAQGTQASTGGSAKNWASQTGAGVTGGGAGDYSSKEWAVGEVGRGVAGEGSAKDWATRTGATVDNASYSAQEHATGTTVAEGSSKEWATKDTSAVASSLFSAKEYSSGSSATGGTSKQWALGGGSFVEATEVTTGLYSARRYASLAAADLVLTNADVVSTNADVALTNQDALDTAADLVATNQDTIDTAADLVATNQDTIDTAADLVQTNQDTIDTAADLVATNQDTIDTAADLVATNADVVSTNADVVSTNADVVSTNADVISAAASQLAARNSAAAIANSFDAFDDKYLGRMADTGASATATTTGTWTEGGSTVTVASNTGIAVGQLFISAGGVGVPTGANVLSIDGTAVVLSDVFTGSDAAEACTFTGYGVYGTFNSSKDGPATDNDNGALVAGMLYFNTTDNEMRICDGTNWIAASAAGTASLQEYKFVTTSGQVSSKTYSGTADVGGDLSYTQSNIIVFLNGVQLKDTTDYAATNGTSIVLVTEPALSDELNVIAFNSFSVTNVEGTTVKSTGESGGTKFLREDGDGTSSWQTVTLATDFVSAASGGTFSGDVSLAAGVDLETSTTGKVKQKGAFMQSSTHQALTLGG